MRRIQQQSSCWAIRSVCWFTSRRHNIFLRCLGSYESLCVPCLLWILRGCSLPPLHIVYHQPLGSSLLMSSHLPVHLSSPNPRHPFLPLPLRNHMTTFESRPTAFPFTLQGHAGDARGVPSQTETGRERVDEGGLPWAGGGTVVHYHGETAGRSREDPQCEARVGNGRQVQAR